MIGIILDNLVEIEVIVDKYSCVGYWILGEILFIF